MSNTEHLTQFAEASSFSLESFVDLQERKKNKPMTFPLHASSIGHKTVQKALVRRLTLLDDAENGTLPDALQNEALAAVRKLHRAQEKSSAAGEGSDAVMEQSNRALLIDAANKVVRAGFIDPQIVLDAADEDLANRKMHISRIDREDRISFFVACQDGNSEQARLLGFREESASDVPGRDNGAVAAVAPVRPAGAPIGRDEL